MIRIGVVGYGYWGPNLVRDFSRAPGSQVTAVCDLSAERLALARQAYPSIHTTHSYRELLADPRIDALVIATPASTHFDLALEALRAGRHVLVEKPMATGAEQARRLIEEAERRGLTLMVDHTPVYSGPVRKVKELIDSGELGQVQYYDAVRVNLGLFQPDVSVIWDLAVHDLSAIDFVLPARPIAVSATGMSHVPGACENIAYMTLFFEGDLIAHVHVNWLAPVKLRRIFVGGTRKMLTCDDLDPIEKVKVYDKGIRLADSVEASRPPRIEYRAGDTWSPQLDSTEALRCETLHFLQCVEQGERPQTDGYAGLRVVHLLEAASRSIQQRGRPVDLDAGLLQGHAG